MDKEDQRMVPYLNQILKNHNMSTFDELQARLNAALTPEQKQMYTDVSVEHHSDECNCRMTRIADGALDAG